MSNIQLQIGQMFSNGIVFRDVIRETAIRSGRMIAFPCSEPGRVQAVCKQRKKGCPWVVWGSKYEENNLVFLLKTLTGTHLP